MDTLENGDPVLRDPYLSKDKVVVITGASSGIGRATAHEFARRGAIVVVSSRNKIALDEVADECRLNGGEALAFPADVTQEQDVNNLAQAAIKEYGRIDIWINNAAVTLFGRFEDVPTADIRQVIETNLFGYIYGARAVIPHFRDQGSGVLINLSAIVAITGQPYTGAYVATKAAERALSESLGQELADEDNIHICTVLPAVIDTPLFQHGGNYMGKEAIPPKPVHPPEMVAEAIADISENPRKSCNSNPAV
jgi:NAD(P)-dependent dehydrogenase (short-subunit alcohol dehydrogenase family)